MDETRVCVCGKEFKPRNVRQYYCCEKCQQDYNRETARELKARARYLKWLESHKGMKQITEINDKALAAGMSYGVYVALKGV